MNTTINLLNLMQDKDYPTAGSALYDAILAVQDISGKIIIDMTGVDSLPSMFLNMSIGRYIETYGKEQMKAKIGFAKVSVSQVARLKEYLERY